MAKLFESLKKFDGCKEKKNDYLVIEKVDGTNDDYSIIRYDKFGKYKGEYTFTTSSFYSTDEADEYLRKAFYGIGKTTAERVYISGRALLCMQASINLEREVNGKSPIYDIIKSERL